MTPDTLRLTILARLQRSHRGHERAISRASLAEAFEIDERTLRSILTELVEEQGYPIARDNHGIYVAITEEEREKNFLRYDAMARSNWKQAHAFRKNAERETEPQRALFEVGR